MRQFLTRNPKLAFIALLAAAIGPRWEQIGRLSLEHFDEGVLVSGAFGVWLKGPWHFPLSQPLQAPPLFPWMVAGAFGITGTPWPIMGIYLSAALGVATVALYFILLRRIYGHSLALAGAGLLAASDLHVAFSRMALTDAALTFWFVASAYLLVRLVHASNQPAATRWNLAFWSLALGLAVGAAWNTKYNGWIMIAIAATTWTLAAARDRLWPLIHAHTNLYRREALAHPRNLLAIVAAAIVAAACFAPWYLYVERTYPGGYGAVTRNHLHYAGTLADWPRRAARLWTSLAAFRHYGWLATVFAMAVAIGCQLGRAAIGTNWRTAKQVAAWLLTASLALSGLAAAVALGGDAVAFALAAAAIVPALVWGRWEEIMFAVWAGAFLIMTPFYHPYTRLLVPALPAAIAIALWLVTSAQGKTVGAAAGDAQNRRLCRASRCALALVCVGILAAALNDRPFGWIPSRRVWNRWSTRQSYRALGDAVLAANLPLDALVLCQGPPAMTLYIEREWAPLEIVPFQKWLARIDPSRDCYLAVDGWGAYAENHQLAWRAIRERLHCLEPVAIVPNDLNLATLLDYLPPSAAARHLSDWPPKRLSDVNGRRVVVPADLSEPFADVIVLYRIDRSCIDRLGD